MLRCFIIAVRYGYISNLRFKLLKEKTQDDKYISKDLLVAQWIEFKPENIKEELEATKWRNEIEDSVFRVKFLEKLQDDLHNRFSTEDIYSTLYKMKTFNMKRFTQIQANLQNTF